MYTTIIIVLISILLLVMVSMDGKSCNIYFLPQSSLIPWKRDYHTCTHTQIHPNKMLKETLYIAGRVQNCTNNKPLRCSLLKVAELATSAPTH